MDNERLLRIELRRALDDVLPPVPWLEAAVTEDLRERRSRRSVDRSPGAQQRSKWLPRPAMQLAAGLLVILLAAIVVVTFLELRANSPQSGPAGTVSIQAYQVMVSRNDGLLNVSRGNNCSDLQSACVAPPGPLATALQQWLDDLNQSEPPARFAVIDAQLRRHIAASISDLDAAYVAFQAQDQNGLLLANQAALNQQHWLDDVASSIRDSQPATPAAYIASVRVANQTFGGCGACQSLVNQVDCARLQSTSCEYAVIRSIGPIEAFQVALVRVLAPSSLAAQDARLQNDLAQVDAGVLAMATAQVTGDQAGFNAGRLLIRQALLAIAVDVVGIVGG